MAGPTAGRSTAAIVVPVVASVVVPAPARRVWDWLVDWPAQGEWMPATRVRVTAGSGRQVGDRVEAWTGIGPVGFTDEFDIVEWCPPNRCVVAHRGRLVRGTGTFDVVALSGGRTRVAWSERLELPLGPLGRSGRLGRFGRLVRPVAAPVLTPVVGSVCRLGLAYALHRLVRQVVPR